MPINKIKAGFVPTPIQEAAVEYLLEFATGPGQYEGGQPQKRVVEKLLRLTSKMGTPDS